METLLQSLYEKIVAFIQQIFNMIFGEWTYNVLFSWLPSDIQAAVTFLIIFLFGLALVKIIRSFLPF